MTDFMHTMPLFRKQSTKGKERFEHQEYLAQENPEPTFDISGCELTEVPAGVFARCRVLQKEALLVNDNWLGSLTTGGKISDLKTIRVFDVHNNELKKLPEDIGELDGLQVLNVEGNRLTKLPNSIGNLRSLQTLNVKRNKIKSLPDSVCQLPCLRMLDISENELTSLPKNLCHIRTLETLVLDSDRMKYPPKEICKKGTEQIMKFLCSESGLEYQPPSNFLLDVLEPPKPLSPTWSENSFKALQEELKLTESVEQYQNVMEKKRQEKVELEMMMQAEQEAHAQMAANSAMQKQHLMEFLAKEEEKLGHDLSELTQKKEEERQRLFAAVTEVEKSADDLLAKLLYMNEKAKKTEELLEAVEKERMEKDGLFDVKWEELQNLRRREVLDAMSAVLQESEGMEKSRQIFTADKQHMARKTLEKQSLESGGQVESLLYHKEAEQKMVFDVLAQQEQLQKQAFEALQLQKDVKHKRITSQIALIQEELSQLTLVEIERRQFNMETEMNIIAEKRIALTAMLSQLLEEREARQEELKNRLSEMEEHREDSITDFWLVQYQRLMDRKPQALLDREKHLDTSVSKILQKANAKDYLPLFARHRITEETMLQLGDQDLKQMGVLEVGLRKSILKNIEIFKAKEKGYEVDLEGASPAVTPTSPPLSPSAPPQDPYALPSVSAFPRRQLSVTARGINSECTICLDRESQVIFLNCGHVCCCAECSGPLTQCPLCRAEIQQKIKLTIPLPPT